MAHIRHRITARALIRANSGRYLLLFTHWDPKSGLEPRWVTPGGGIEENEPLREAACREVFEETGLKIEPADLGETLASIEFKVHWSEEDYETGIAHMFLLEVTDEFEIDKTHWTIDEHRDILQARWWSSEDLFASGERVGPAGLLELMQQLATNRR